MSRESRFNYILSLGDIYIFYNMVSKSIVLSKSLDLSEDNCKTMKENGFWVDENIDEILKPEENFLQSIADMSYLSLTIIPTFQCNLCCKYCYQDHSIHSISKLKLITLGIKLTLLKSKTIRTLHIEWFGGEPSLLIDEISDAAKEIKNVCDEKQITFSSSINTNLYNFSNDVIQTYKEAKINQIVTTLAGWRDAHDKYRVDIKGMGSYDKVLQSIAIAHKHFPITICINLTKQSLLSINKLFQDLERFDKEKITLTFLKVFETGKDIGDAFLNENEYIDALVKWTEYALTAGFYVALESNFSGKCLFCGAQHKNSFTISPQGHVFKCIDNCVDNLSIGYMDENGINISYEKDYNPYQDAQCRICSILPYCNGGCEYKKHQGIDRCPNELYVFDKVLYLHVISYLRDHDYDMFRILLEKGTQSIKKESFSVMNGKFKDYI